MTKNCNKGESIATAFYKSIQRTVATPSVFKEDTHHDGLPATGGGVPIPLWLRHQRKKDRHAQSR